ncbi:hypothetical protein NFI96_019168 [Prochilodus magdalenae]|nr:hypothetical protein NFI96_019168 [Prochilodus magdalenae]
MLKAGSRSLSTAPADSVTSVTCAQCEEYRAPVANLPILVFSGKCQASCTVLGCEHNPHLWTSGPHTILMESVSDRLCRHMHSGLLEVFLQGSGSAPPDPPCTKAEVAVLLLGCCPPSASSTSPGSAAHPGWHINAAVARRFAVSVSVVSRAWRCYQETGQYTRRRGGGRRRATTQQQDRYLRLCARRIRRSTARALQKDLQAATRCACVLCHKTGQKKTDSMRDGMRARTSHRWGLSAHRRPNTGCRMLGHLPEEHQDWQIRHWRPVLFTLSTCDRRDRVRRRRGERSAACLQHDRFGSGSVMVWGGISLEGRTAPHVLARGSLTALRYQDEIHRTLVRPYAGAVGPGFLLMQDNARPHAAGVGQQFLQDEGSDAMDRPARSPDLKTD